MSNCKDCKDQEVAEALLMAVRLGIDHAVYTRQGEWRGRFLGWGAHGGHRARDFHVVHRLGDGIEWRCLGMTHQGHPKHPLYVPKSQQMVPFVGRAK